MGKVKLIISGNVQGVGFRYFAKSHAIMLGLVGYVKNLNDGSVEVVAAGDDLKLKELIAACRNGPLNSKVDEVKADWLDANENFVQFEILD